MKSVHITLRIKAELADRADALKREDESRTALFNRIIEAGLDALEDHTEDHGDDHEAASGNSTELEALKLAVETLSTQLTAAMDHNAELTEALKREQDTAQAALTLQGITQAKRLEDEPGKRKRRGFMSRLFGRGTDGEEES